MSAGCVPDVQCCIVRLKLQVRPFPEDSNQHDTSELGEGSRVLFLGDHRPMLALSRSPTAGNQTGGQRTQR